MFVVYETCQTDHDVHSGRAGSHRWLPDSCRSGTIHMIPYEMVLREEQWNDLIMISLVGTD